MFAVLDRPMSVRHGGVMADPHDLLRFTSAQDRNGTYDAAVRELSAGRKTTHWMWFIFPQLRGLGSSSISIEFAISSLAEAEAYMIHPVLGPRLRDCTALVRSIQGSSIREIFGSPDDLKFRS